MIIAITGSNGFIGKQLKRYLVQKGLKVVSVPREILYRRDAIMKHLKGVDAIINLAGFPITKRWSEKNRLKIYDSRAITTQNIVEAINKMDTPPSVLISTSAIGIYNNIHYHDEDSEDYSSNFLGDVCQAWEAPIGQVNTEYTRTVIARLGVVLGDGGMLKPLRKVYKLGLGARIGHGEYAMPFVHINDVLKFFDVALGIEDYSGVYNVVAPDIITNQDFTEAMTQSLNKKARFTVPVFLLKILMGKGVMTVINNPIVIPKRLLEAGFVFECEQIGQALDKTFNSNK